MKAEDVKIYREIQKNAEVTMKEMETISEKVYDKTLAMQISGLEIKYSDLRARAMGKLLQGKAEIYRKSAVEDAILTGGIHARTLLNNSTSHIAELLIEESNRNIIKMCKVLNHNKTAGTEAVEMAKEWMNFEEKNIAKLKKFL